MSLFRCFFDIVEEIQFAHQEHVRNAQWSSVFLAVHQAVEVIPNLISGAWSVQWNRWDVRKGRILWASHVAMNNLLDKNQIYPESEKCVRVFFFFKKKRKKCRCLCLGAVIGF